jgi:hypothetical protein
MSEFRPPLRPFGSSACNLGRHFSNTVTYSSAPRGALFPGGDRRPWRSLFPDQQGRRSPPGQETWNDAVPKGRHTYGKT